MNPLLIEGALLALTAVSFWVLDRYVIGCGRV